jgi:6,7-dimethyl-8-ribityllumazine synthase
VAVVVSRYNATVTDRLRDGSIAAYLARGGRRGDLLIVEAPGAFELSVLCSEAARSGRFAGVVALGCVIKGETRHDEYIAHAVAHGVTSAAVRTGVPIAFGLLTTENAGQARERAGGIHGNKGEEAMNALLDTIAALRTVAGKPAGKGAGRIARPVRDKAAAASKVRRGGR